MRPLDRIPSIKVKFGIVIVAAVFVAAVTSYVGWRLGWPVLARPIVAAVVSLGMVQVLAKGMTRPLREMERAATEMARGNHVRRVETTSTDEVGRLAEAFNTMAAELGETDRQRRELVANVSHELRTPVAALQATVENLLDGVTPADDATFEAMHHQTLRLGRLVRDLVELSRLETGAATLELVDVDLGPLARRVIDEARLVHAGAVVDLAPVTVADHGESRRPAAPPGPHQPRRQRGAPWRQPGRGEARRRAQRQPSRLHRHRPRPGHPGGRAGPRLRTVPSARPLPGRRPRRGRARAVDRPLDRRAPRRAHHSRRRARWWLLDASRTSPNIRR